MKEVPENLGEVFNKLVNDGDYFEYALLNGGIMLVLAIPIIGFFIFWAVQESNLKKRKR